MRLRPDAKGAVPTFRLRPVGVRPAKAKVHAKARPAKAKAVPALAKEDMQCVIYLI